MALSKDRKNELVDQYKGWLDESQAVILAEYTGMNMQAFNKLRADLRDVGGEFHVIKNTLGKIVFEEAGLEVPADWFEGSTALGFALEDVAGVTKALSDYAKESDFVKIKGGYLDRQSMSAAQIEALADLPPLPVMRAMLLGTILAPASQLVRVLNEPARSLAAVVNAYSEQQNAAA